MEVDFLNARGAIARFDRGSIELRVMDVQEYPAADVAICAAVVSVLQAMCSEEWSTTESQMQMETGRLHAILDDTIKSGEGAKITDAQFLKLLGLTSSGMSARAVWGKLLDRRRRQDRTLDNLFAPLEIILERGTLATRIRSALGASFSSAALRDVYGELADCLTRWQPFSP
jgi:hypothetical protein